MWSKPPLSTTLTDMNSKSSSDNESHTESLHERESSPSPAMFMSPKDTSTTDVQSVFSNQSVNKTVITDSVISTTASGITNILNVSLNSNAAATECNTSSTSSTNNNSITKQNMRAMKQSEYARKEKQQLDMPLFFQTPNNHKMVT